MSKRALFSIFVLMIAVDVCCATDDNQGVRAGAGFSFALNDMWKMTVTQKFHFRDGEHNKHENVVSFKYKAADWLDVGLGFKQYHKESGHEWQRENRPYVEATAKEKWLGLKWSNRNRLEFRDFEQGNDVFRYRNRLKAHVPHDLFDLPVQPYGAYECFVQEASGLHQTRIYSGMVWDVNERLDVDIFVFHEKKQTTHGWDDRYTYGFETKFSF